MRVAQAENTGYSIKNIPNLWPKKKGVYPQQLFHLPILSHGITEYPSTIVFPG